MMSLQSYRDYIATRIGIPDLPHMTTPQHHMPLTNAFDTNTIPYGEYSSIHHTYNKFLMDVSHKWERIFVQLYAANHTIRNLKHITKQGTKSSSRESTLVRKELVTVSRENRV